MWHSERILADVSKRTGLTISEIQNSPWSVLEEKMKIKKLFTGRTINRRGHHSVGMRKVTREMFDEDEILVTAATNK